MKKDCQILWFKKDLRIFDHKPLLEASKTFIPTIPIYIFETNYWKQPFSSKRHWYFIHDCLLDLDKQLKSINSELFVFKDGIIKVLKIINKMFNLKTIYAHEETSNLWTYERDKKVIEWCNLNEVKFHEFPTNGVIRKLKNRNNWSKLRNKRMSEELYKKPQSLKTLKNAFMTNIPSKNDKVFEKGLIASYQKGGRKRGIALINNFLNKNLDNYLKHISGPSLSEKFCSRLSPHLTHGTISVKEVYKLIDKHKKECDLHGILYNKRSLSAFRSRLSWRCHFIQKLEDQPLIENTCMHIAYEGMRSKSPDKRKFEAWKSGKTGFPFIDACMRYLIYHGWITFRMRAMLTSFASYDLWIDWRKSGYVLAKLFTDYEPGIHYSQLQMQSGVTGINTLRIYNPIKQSMEHDIDGVFIKKWVPELKKVPISFIHEPWKMNLETQINCNCLLEKNYPKPIIDHKKAIQVARQKISEIRKKDSFKVNAKKVFEKHGSRKNKSKINHISSRGQLSLFT